MDIDWLTGGDRGRKKKRLDIELFNCALDRGEKKNHYKYIIVQDDSHRLVFFAVF